MNLCRKCSKAIPATIKIDGKRRNLKNRKFCLVCSPFGSHNTKPDDPARKAVYGQENYKKKSYKVWDEKAKETHRKQMVKRATNLKEKAINTKGGKCLACGNDNISMLTFHHRDRDSKLFGLDKASLRLYSWEEIEKELEKCDILCQNCHMEIEEKYQDQKGHKNQHLRGLERKRQAVEKLGGKCKTCNYSKCLRCLSFHHRDPSIKSFPLDIRSFNGYSWDKLQPEIDKCDLYCLNCHRDLENTLRKSRYLR